MPNAGDRGGRSEAVLDPFVIKLDRDFHVATAVDVNLSTAMLVVVDQAKQFVDRIVAVLEKQQDSRVETVLFDKNRFQRCEILAGIDFDMLELSKAFGLIENINCLHQILLGYVVKLARLPP